MMHTIRVLYPQFTSTHDGWQGAASMTFPSKLAPWDPTIITKDSTVLISASEYRQVGVMPDGTTPEIQRFHGKATITISKIVPEDGQVNFDMLSDWGTPVNVALDFVVIDSPAQMIDASSGTTYTLTPAPTPAPSKPGPIVGTRPEPFRRG
jgi:hypothetical protein